MIISSLGLKTSPARGIFGKRHVTFQSSLERRVFPAGHNKFASGREIARDNRRSKTTCII